MYDEIRTGAPRTLTLSAPAKLNLSLDILRRREDGYHDLRMVMQSVSLRDTVTIREKEGGFSLQAGGDFLRPGVPSMEERAAEQFFAALSRPVPGLCVTLDKRIPAYAGMGGGSADVAAVLHGLRRLYCPQMPLAELEQIGLSIGSDVPFCIRGGTALAEGRGERLRDLPPLPPCHIVICKPPFGIPTPALFARVRVEALGRRPDTDGMVSALEQGDLAGVAARLCNVFEEVLPPEYGAVHTLKEQLLELGALNAAMSGSGPTVFGLFSSAQAAAQAAAALEGGDLEVFLAQPVKKTTELE